MVSWAVRAVTVAPPRREPRPPSMRRGVTARARGADERDARRHGPVSRVAPNGTGKQNTAPPRAPSRRRRIVIGIVAFIVALAVAVGVLGVVLWTRVDRVAVTFPGSPPGGTTFLLIGSDSRGFVKASADHDRFGSAATVTGERADVMLLVRITREGRVRVLGIPRDLLVPLPEGAPVRMTLTLLRGPQTVVDTACRSLGVGIDHVAIVHFDGLRRVVDSLGGIDVATNAPERDLVTGLSLTHAGVNRLNGDQALAYVRSRQLEQRVGTTWQPETPTALARSSRAREVLSRIGAGLQLSPTAPVDGLRRMWALSGAVTIDDDASPVVVRELAHGLARLGHAPEARLPVVFHPGDLPTADLQPGAAAILTAFQGGTQPGCSFRPLPRPNSSVAPPIAAVQPSGGTP